jgi:hypothetical protein
LLVGVHCAVASNRKREIHQPSIEWNPVETASRNRLYGTVGSRTEMHQYTAIRPIFSLAIAWRDHGKTL